MSERSGCCKIENCESLPFSAIPHSSRLFLDFLAYDDQVQTFYAHPPTVAAVAAYARQLRESDHLYPEQRRQQVVDVLKRQNGRWGCGAATFAALEKLRNGAVVAISGQQVGMLGGPMYSLLKAISAIEMAETLERQGVPAVPLFWMATEDHDLAEIATVTLPRSGELQEIVADGDSRNANNGAPVGRIAMDGGAMEAVDAARRLLHSDWVNEALEASYGEPGVSYGEAFARLFTRLLGHTGLILVDPLDDELHAIAAPVLGTAAARAEELGDALLARGRDLRQAGYHEQVRVAPESTLLFSLEGNRRTAVHRAGADFLIGARRIERGELLARIARRPQDFSPNVLLRPLVQDYLFPTAVYFGGPAELAYFAQAAVVYEKLLGRHTPVLPRFSATLVSAEMARLLTQYRLSLAELFHGSAQAYELLASRTLTPALQTALAETQTAVRDRLAQLKLALEPLDHTLVEAAEHSERKMLYQVAKLGRKAARARLRQSATLEVDAQRLLTDLFPHKGLQERTLPGIYFLAQYGPELIERLKEAAARHDNAHQLLWL